MTVTPAQSPGPNPPPATGAWQDPRAGMRRRAAALLLLVVVLLSAWGGFTLYRTVRLYRFLKAGVLTLMSAGVFEYDPVLGYRAHPGAAGAMLMPLPPDVPVHYDASGFRVPAGETSRQLVRPLILTLGCSFTHGDGVPAEATFAHRLGGIFGGTVLNAGFCGYGLAQMLLRARQLIPAFRPDVVVVQYAPWLVSRALSEFAPTVFGLGAQTYFARAADGELYLQPPPFRSTLLDLSVAEYRGTPAGPLDFLSFLRHVGGPLFAGDDVDLAGLRLRRWLGLLPPPADDRLAVVRLVYGEIRALCEAAGGRMVVVVLATPLDVPRADEVAYLRSLPGVVYADAYAAQLARLAANPGDTYAETNRRFLAAYAQYRGNPPVLVDAHPNPAAHALIAETIAAAWAADAAAPR